MRWFLQVRSLIIFTVKVALGVGNNDNGKKMAPGKNGTTSHVINGMIFHLQLKPVLQIYVLGWTSTYWNGIKTRQNPVFSHPSNKKTEKLRIKVWSSYINSSKSRAYIRLNSRNGEADELYMYVLLLSNKKNRTILKYINDETCKTLVEALIIFRLDYGNALLYNIPLSLRNHLQRVQNCAARLVTRTRKREHITPVWFQLHWVPIRFRSLYNTLFHTFNVLSGTAPLYLSDLIATYIPVRMIRSELSAQKAIQQCTERNPSKHQLQAVEQVAKLAATKEVFCEVLKTHLFKLAYL